MSEPTIATLLGLEGSVCEALKREDLGADLVLLSPSFLGVYPSGMNDRQGHASQLEDGPSVVRYEIREPQVKALSPTMGLLSYRARFVRPDCDRVDEMYVTSIGCLEAGRWLNVFSQDTLVTEEKEP